MYENSPITVDSTSAQAIQHTAGLINLAEKFSRPVVAGFDIGFAQCKMSVPAFGIKTTIPSAVAVPQYAKEGIGGGQVIFALPIGKFVFGADALIPGAKQLQSLDTEWLLRYFPGFVCAVAKAGGVDLHSIDELATGLPIDAWRKHKVELEEMLKTITCNGETYRFNKVTVRPQGVGALGYYNELVKPDPFQCGLVLDLGGNTVLSVRFDNLRPIGTDTREYDQLGMLAIGRNLTDYLSAMNGGRVVTEIKAMKAVLDGKFIGHDISSKVKESIATHSEFLLAALRKDYRDIIPDLEVIVAVGGGVHLLGPALTAEYGSKVFIMEEPEYANASGYAAMSAAN